MMGHTTSYAPNRRHAEKLRYLSRCGATLIADAGASTPIDTQPFDNPSAYDV